MIEKKIDYKYEVILLLLKKSMHQREIAHTLQTSLTRVQSILSELRGLNAVDYEQVGKNHKYFIKKNIISKALVINAENYKLIKLIAKHPWIEVICKEILNKEANTMCILFGSYAKGLEKKTSDIDIYINTHNTKIKSVIENIHPLVTVKIGTFDPSDLLIREIIKDHIIIRGVEQYYENIKFFT